MSAPAVQRVLCTTAIEATWPDEGPVLFLGEWCRRYSRRERWSRLDAELVPYHWDDRARLYADYQYLMALHESLLVELAGELNRIHGVQYSPRYWRILTGPWLGAFVQMLFDRWTSIRAAVAIHDISETRVLGGAGQPPVPNDMVVFDQWFVDDVWNHHLCAHILREFTDIPCREIPAGAGRRPPAAGRRPLAARLKSMLLRACSGVLGTLAGPRDSFLVQTYLPPREEVALSRRLNGRPAFWLPPAAPRVPADAARRTWQLPGAATNDFENCARALIPRHIPAVFLEGYAALTARARELPWPKRPGVIWTSNLHRWNDVFNAWAAVKVEQGAALVIGQHGGHYGTGLWCFAEDHDIAIADRYFSWGWSDPRPQVVPLGKFSGASPAARKPQATDELLLVTCSLPRYSYWMYSAAVAGQWQRYFEDQRRFVSALPDGLSSALRVRLYPADFGWDQVARWRDAFPALRIDDGRLDMRELMARCRVYVATYNATTFLESIAADVPTVIFWNEAHWELRDSARRHFDALKTAGVFHATAESAARHVAHIWNDVDGWWRSGVVRAALAGFQANYCARPADLQERLAAALRGAAR